MTRASARIVEAFRDAISMDNPARLMAPSKADMELVRTAILNNKGRWHDIRDMVTMATRRATEKDRDPPVSSVRYGLKAWENEQEKKRREHEKRCEREPELRPGYYQPAPVEPPEEVSDEDRASIARRIAELRAKLNGGAS